MTSLFEHIVDQYPEDLRKTKYEYWARLKRANEDFRAKKSPRIMNGYTDFVTEKLEFERWMREQWGLEVVVEQDGYSPYYTVLDEKKYLLFVMKYGNK